MDVVWIMGGIAVTSYAAGAAMGYVVGRANGFAPSANQTETTNPVGETSAKPVVDKPARMLAARMRKYKARRRKALKLHREGLTPKGIARELGVTTASVRNYLRKEPRDAADA